MTVSKGNLQIRVRLAPGAFNSDTTFVQFALDTDQNPATGHPGVNNLGTLDAGIIGSEFLVNMGSAFHAGSAKVFKYVGPPINTFASVASFPVTFSQDGMDAIIPLSAVDNDDGRLNFKVNASVQIGPNAFTSILDFMPNVGLPAGSTDALDDQQADLGIMLTPSASTVASGERFIYTIRASNSGPGTATGVMVNTSTPVGTTLATISASQGTFTSPGVGGTGAIICSLGSIAVGGSATITISVNVLAASGSSLSDAATVSSSLADPNPANNSATAGTPVQGGGVVKLIWDQPTPSASNPTPAPINLRVVAGELAATEFRSTDSADSASALADSPCALLRVNVYKSDVQPVLTMPDNLWKSVPRDQLQTAMAAAPGGSFYVITNVWQCGDETIESGGSNQASVPAGPTLARVKVGRKIKVIGSGFTDPAQVFLDGVEFVKQTVFADSTLVVQKGALTDGRTITDVVRPGRTVIISVRNSNGGLSSIAFVGQ
ncbi:MAG: DUF11 domain-containing protein [Blastocatellia bacterium]